MAESKAALMSSEEYQAVASAAGLPGDLRVLVIRRGFGNKGKIRWQTLKGVVEGAGGTIHMWDTCNDADDAAADEEEISRYAHRIAQGDTKPSVLVCLSSGGSVLQELVKRGAWGGVTWIISARCVSALGATDAGAELPALFSHGTRDNWARTQEVAEGLRRAEFETFEVSRGAACGGRPPPAFRRRRPRLPFGTPRPDSSRVVRAVVPPELTQSDVPTAGRSWRL